MFTPQQIDQISFRTSRMQAGYNIDDVDAFLEPLTEDYVTLYKENALLKSKMRVLVGKLEEYRKNEISMKEAIANAQRTCDRMMHEAEVKAAQMVNNASAAAAITRNSDALIAAEEARVNEARKAAAVKIAEIQDQMQACIQALERIKSANRPTPEYVPAGNDNSDAIAYEIAHNLEVMVGTTEDVAPKAAPKHPTNDTTTSRFANLNLQFGRNYDPTTK